MSPVELQREFDSRFSILDAFGKWVTSKIVDNVTEILGADYSVDFFKIPPKHRVKKTASFLEKALSGRKKYANPLFDITDQVGTRFVILLSRDCLVVNEAIKKIPEIEATKAKDIQETRDQNPHYFDYESFHWTVQPKAILNCFGVEVDGTYHCEIQVRTLLQHAYAELAHATVYKPNISAKPSLKRIIAKGAALIETTDGLFGEVADQFNLACKNIDLLLRFCGDWFRSHIGTAVSPFSTASYLITDAFADQLAMVTTEEISHYLDDRTWIVEKLRERKEDPLHSNPVILLVYWLVSEIKSGVFVNWPLDPATLEYIFSDLGVSIGDESF